ncbi:MAG: 23S rRNA (uracil(1939)-C(5))-methyltransferase RlmD [Fidelibacterota bacterium]
MTLKFPKKGEIVSLKIEALAFGGMGISHIGEMVVFVKNAIPGQVVNARILKKRSSYLEAKRISVDAESPHFVAPACDHFEYCGGCTFQNLAYPQQLSAKAAQVNDIYQRIGGFPEVRIDPIVGCDEIFNYRNKMEFTFSNRRFITEADEDLPRDFALGAHTAGKFDKILNIDECRLQHPVCNDILQYVKLRVRELGLAPYDIVNHIGFMRYLVLRTGSKTGEIMVNLVTASESPVKLQPLVDELIQRFPSIVSIVNNITSRKSGVSVGEKETILFGRDYLTDNIGELQFHISANSFFQTNTRQAATLYEIVRHHCGLTGKETVYDLFCGAGSISLFVASSAKEVLGFELVPSAIRDARQNAELNGIENVRFFEGNLMDMFRDSPELSQLPLPDVLIIDPPRAGLHPHTVKDILTQSPRRIVYVSCNPSTQVRDVRLLCDEGYTLDKIIPVDMFPHTPHIETVAILTKD